MPTLRASRPLLASACLLASFTAAHAQAVAPAPQPVMATTPTPAQARHTPTDKELNEAQRTFVEGGKAVQAHDLARALDRFSRAASLDPSNTNYQAALTIARQNRITELIELSSKSRMLNDAPGARAELEQAVALDRQSPVHNPTIDSHLDELARDREDEERANEPAVFRAPADTSLAQAQLVPSKTTPPQSFHLYLPRDQVIKQVFQAWGLVPLLDKSVTQPTPGDDARVHYDQDNVTFEQALQALELATNTFTVPLDPMRALVATDVKANRDQFERLTQETVYMPGLSTAEMTDVANMAKNVFLATQAVTDDNAHTLSIRAPMSKIKPLNLTLTGLMQGRSEILLDVDMYELNYVRDGGIGIQLSDAVQVFNLDTEVQSIIQNNSSLVEELIEEGLATSGNIDEIAIALIASGAVSSVLSSPFAYFGGGLTLTGISPSSTTGSATLSLTDSRLVDRMQMRLLDQEEGTFKVGERYPIVTSSYSALATTSTTGIAGLTGAGTSAALTAIENAAQSAGATTPQVQYQDLGLSLKATSRVQGTDDVNLKIDFQLTALAGQTLNENPVLNSRSYQSITTLHAGERAVVVSHLSNQESNELVGLPFLSEIPGFHLWTDQTKDDTVDTLVIVMTPHIVRLAHRGQDGPMIVIPQHS